MYKIIRQPLTGPFRVSFLGLQSALESDQSDEARIEFMPDMLCQILLWTIEVQVVLFTTNQ
jgi:hypothetical protein